MFGYGRAQATAALVAATLFIWFTSLHRDGEAILCLIGDEAQTYENVGFALIVLVFMLAIPLPHSAATGHVVSQGPRCGS